MINVERLCLEKKPIFLLNVHQENITSFGCNFKEQEESFYL
jgi:hypothetical protein